MYGRTVLNYSPEKEIWRDIYLHTRSNRNMYVVCVIVDMHEQML